MNEERRTTYGIIGYPLTHTLSPVLHNAAFEACGVNAVYKAFPIKPEDLESFFDRLRGKESPIFGLNVTVPYKEKVMDWMDSLSPFAEKVQAVNTIRVSPDRKLMGYNTDGPGFLAHGAELGIHFEGKRVAVLGSGGTTRAILTAFCLLPEKPRTIRLYNRTLEKAQRLVEELGQRMDTRYVEVVPSLDDLRIPEGDILINTTPVGMRSDDPLLVDPQWLHKDLFVYDVIYSPPETRLLSEARVRGARTANGLGMLFYQGVLAFQHWADTMLSEEVKVLMRQRLEEAAQS